MSVLMFTMLVDPGGLILLVIAGFLMYIHRDK